MAGPAQASPCKEELLAKLTEGVDTWNQWRRENPEIEPDLSSTDIFSKVWPHLGSNLSGVNFRQTNLSGSGLSRLNLSGAQMNDANLSAANFTESILEQANLANSDLTNAVLAGAQLLKADLRDANLKGAKLDNADLRQCTASGVKLAGCVLRRTNLRNAGLRGANLEGAKLEEVDLYDADLRDANLRNADLSNAKTSGLRFPGADLNGATLPDTISKLYEKLGSVSDISDSAQKLFIGLLAGCLYCWLTIGTTRDVDLITNRASSPLPIIQTPIPIVGFYILAPIILLCIYFYFHFYLQKLWEELAKFPAIFPDGQPLYARADPWLFNDLVRAHFSRLKKDRPFLSYFQKAISILLAWWVVPLTLAWFWLRYMPRHDLVWTTVLAALLAVSIVSAWRLHHLTRQTLGGNKRLSFRETFKSPGFYLTTFATIVLGAAAVLISRSAILGTPEGWVARTMARVHYSPFPNLQDADVSVKPPNWTGKKDEELDLVKGADLSGRDLRYAKLRGAFLAKAGLYQSRLEKANLISSDLRQANLREAHLEYAELSSAHLGGATLYFADLQDTHLNLADLTGADLGRADLTNADLSFATLTGAHLDGATLAGANLYHADLRHTGLTKAQIASTSDWDVALLDEDLLQELGVKDPKKYNDDLEKQIKQQTNLMLRSLNPTK